MWEAGLRGSRSPPPPLCGGIVWAFGNCSSPSSSTSLRPFSASSSWFLHPLPAVVVPQASASNVVVMVPPARAGWRGVVVLQGAWDHPATPPHRGDRQWWSQATFTPLPPAAFFAGASRANLVVLPGLPPFVHL
uniref:Uncharacterized protein n=1 Tax=Coccidioides posadasii RMSCC 3488 TaxID=454284 RepID=A0A0J6FS06_COCPO|nr:hypothetical protein CPAG_08513 [Coccidioides posadasii RMSCC 3488]